MVSFTLGVASMDRSRMMTSDEQLEDVKCAGDKTQTGQTKITWTCTEESQAINQQKDAEVGTGD